MYIIENRNYVDIIFIVKVKVNIYSSGSESFHFTEHVSTEFGFRKIEDPGTTYYYEKL